MAPLAGVVHQVAHHFEEIVPGAKEFRTRRDFQFDFQALVQVNLVQRFTQLVQRRLHIDRFLPQPADPRNAGSFQLEIDNIAHSGQLS